jgi:hypothetical protein
MSRPALAERDDRGMICLSGLEPQVRRDVLQVLDETTVFLFALRRFRMSKDSRRMNRDKDGCGEGGRPGPASHFTESNGLGEDRLGCGCAEADDDSRVYHLHFGFQPGPAGGDLSRRWFLVFAALALRFPFKVFYGICDVQVPPVYPGFAECLVQKFSRRSHKRMTNPVFLISRLLANQDDRSMSRSFSKDGLGGLLVQIASRAAGGRLS